MVLDPGLLSIVKVAGGLSNGGIMVVNAKSPEAVPAEFRARFHVATVDANHIAREVLGVNIVNTTMIGALLKAAGVVDVASLDEPMKKRFGKLTDKNLAALRRAYDETVVEEVSRA